MIIYLIRHGRSLANERQLVTGTPEDPLSDIGQAQAAAMATWMYELPVRPDRYMVSHWRRARETAEIIFPTATWITDPRLGETNAGSVADKPLSEFRQELPYFYDRQDNKYPDGESHQDLNRRVLEWLREQTENSCRVLAVVAHSGPISCILQHILGIDMSSFPALLPRHASASVVHITYESGIVNARLAGFSVGPAQNIAGMFYVP